MVLGRTNRRLPPYVSYRTFGNFLDLLQQHGMPARIDRSFWGDRFSGSTGTQLIGALRFLSLTDDLGAPTARLKQLVNARGSQRAEIVKAVTQESYAFILQGAINPQNATYSQFEEVLHANYELAGDVARKCIKFFVGLAEDGEIPLSTFVTKKSSTRSSPGTKKSVKKSPAKASRNSIVPSTPEEIENRMPLDKILMTKFPSFDPAWSDEVKGKWFDAFDQILKRIGGGA